MIEQLRRIARPMLGWHSWPYRLVSRLYGTAAILLSEGPRTLLTIRRLSRTPRADGVAVSVRFRRLLYPFLLRPGTKDINTAINNFVRCEYGQIDSDLSPRTMIDAGAYVGDTTAYFLSRFPDLQCIAVEPNPESLRLARRNLAPYGDRVTLLPYAVSTSEAPVKISGAETGARISETDGIEVKGTTILNLLERLPGCRANILKLDVEGVEDAIFKANPETWLPQVDCIIVETHGSGVTRSVLAALKRNGWLAVRFRNLYYCRPAHQARLPTAA